MEKNAGSPTVVDSENCFYLDHFLLSLNWWRIECVQTLSSLSVRFPQFPLRPLLSSMPPLSKLH